MCVYHILIWTACNFNPQVCAGWHLNIVHCCNLYVSTMILFLGCASNWCWVILAFCYSPIVSGYFHRFAGYIPSPAVHPSFFHVKLYTALILIWWQIWQPKVFEISCKLVEQLRRRRALPHNLKMRSVYNISVAANEFLSRTSRLVKDYVKLSVSPLLGLVLSDMLLGVMCPLRDLK